MSKDAKHAVDLQKKIFGRWVKLKLNARNIPFDDVLKDLADGLNLINLLEILSGKEYANRKKLIAQPKMKPHFIDNCSQALGFTWEVGVDMKLKPSAENLADGNETQVLGLLWAIMLKFMKFGDDEGDDKSLNAKDALMMWVQNQVQGYKGVAIENMTKSFHDGLAFCALIHKFRPKLVKFEALDPANTEANLNIAFDAAEKFFGLEKYLLPSDIPQLDEKSMVVYVSEYYYGIAQQRKVDLAARRIHKVVKFTKEMDAKKADYVQRSKKLRVHVDGVAKLLNDRTIDNTMAGAKRKLEEFYNYKTKDKGEITDTYLSIESVFNQLAMKLADNRRPEFKPEAGTSIPDLRQTLVELENVEKERKVALHAELNRQIKLAKTNELHQERYNSLQEWGAKKKQYLNFKEEIHSVGEAEFQLNTLTAFRNESKAVHEGTVQELKQQGDYLRSEKFEFSQDVSKREEEITALFGELNQLAESKLLILQDHLAREKYAEEIRGLNQQHVAKHDKQQSFIQEKKTYFTTKEVINSVSDANLHISIRKAHQSQKDDLQAATYPALTKLGQDIRDAKYQTSYSSWVFETPQAVTAREESVLQGFQQVDQLSAEKAKVLDDDLAREQFKEAVRLQNQQHIDRHAKLTQWLSDSHSYLSKKEQIGSIGEANLQLSLLKTHVGEKQDMSSNNFVALKKLGEEIRNAKYETGYSRWVFEDPNSVSQRENDVQQGFDTSDKLAAAKLEVLEDDLARETFKEDIRLKNQQHKDKYDKVNVWIGESRKKLETKEVINSIPEANLQLSLLRNWIAEKKDLNDNTFRALKTLGGEIVNAKYSTKHSSWSFETPAEVQEREAAIDKDFTVLDALAAEKLLVLEDDLARETFKENLRLSNQQHVERKEQIRVWVEESKKLLTKVEPVDSITEAHANLSNLAAWKAEKADVTNINVAALKRLGADILSAKYASKYSSFVWETPAEIKERESYVDSAWVELDGLADEKKAVLDSDLARELRKEALRVEFANLALDFTRWAQDAINASTKTVFGFTLDEVEAFAATLSGLDKGLTEVAESKKTAYENVWAQLTELKVTRNSYTTDNPDSLAAVRTQLDQATQVRRGKFEEELARQRANDKLCKDFAGVVEPFVQRIDATKDAISNSKEDLEKQLADVDQKIAQTASDDFGLSAVRDLQAQLDEKGITDNRHTILTFKDAEVVWQQYVAFLGRKRGSLTEEIAHKRLRGLTEEQMREIEAQFQHFDKNKNGFLDRSEFKTCLYSLNEDKTKQEVTAIMDKYGKDGLIAYEGFREFMISVLGDTDTKEEVVEGFALINKGADATVPDLMGLVLDDEDLAFIASTAPTKGSGLDYKAWTDEVYSR